MLLRGAGIPQRLLFFQALGGVFFNVLVQFLQLCFQCGEDVIYIIFDGGLVVLDGGLVSGDGGLCGVGLGYQRGQLLFLGELVKLRCAEQGELLLLGEKIVGIKIIGIEVLGVVLLNFVQHIAGASGGTGDLTGGAVGHTLLGIVDHVLCLDHLFAGIFQRLFCVIQQFFRLGEHLGGDFIQPLSIEDDMHLPRQRTGDVHAGHAGDTRQFLLQLLVDEVAQLLYLHALIADGRHHDRQHGGVNFHGIGSGHCVVPAALQRRQLLLDVEAEGVHIRAVLKLQHHHGSAVLGGGGDGLDMIQCGHGFLDGAGDLLLDALGAGTGIGGHHDDVGEVHVGHQVRRHLHIGHHAQDDHRQRNNEHRQRFFHTKFRNHTAAPCLRKCKTAPVVP